ncbi:hypothetical protein LCGC14_0142510 [marine sediment metagenome]|uniref:Uncharacterized protein n=1 Tax=marine sediment metagenome TaxID=412755 RepID=A0A0F9XIG7_9ZZZZ
MSRTRGRSKTVWIREYDSRGKLVQNNGSYAIRKYNAYGNRFYYSVSISPKRQSWYQDFFCFSDAKQFARGLTK